MPKESKPPVTSSLHWSTAPYPQQHQQQQPQSQSQSPAQPQLQLQYIQPGQQAAPARPAAIWSAADDEILLQARASGLNWQPIASRHFPTKTANACRKRHERLVERRHAEDWNTQKLEMLAQEYMACRKEMWEVLAARLGERWSVVEAKCMEKGLKTLQATARTAHRRASLSYGVESFEEAGSGNSDHHSDSGIGFGSDAEMEVGDEARLSTKSTINNTRPSYAQQPFQLYSDHGRSRSLPVSLPIYRPPPPPVNSYRYTVSGPSAPVRPEFSTASYASIQRNDIRTTQRGGISIQSVLSPAEI